MDLNRDQKLGAVFVLFAALLVFAWVPLDVDSGLVEKIRRQVSIGDALAPSLAGLFLAFGGVGLLIFGGRNPETDAPLDLVAMRFAALLFAVYFCAFLLMLAIGPTAVWLTNLTTGNELEYRLLRDSSPWKYLGFATGGTAAVAGTIALLEGRFSMRSLLTALIAVATMIAVYDLPFDDLLLPPNGDF